MAHAPVHPLISGVFLILALCIHPVVAIAAATPAVPGEPVPDAIFPIDGEPFRVAAGDGAVWVTTGYRSVVKLDADSGEVLATVRLPGQRWDLAVDGDTVWVLTPDGGGTRKIVVPTMPGGTTPGEGRLAVAGLHRIDTASGEVVETIPLELYGGGLAVTDGAVWVGAAAAAEGEPGMLLGVDPTSNAVVASIPIDDAFIRVSAVSASDDGVWAIAQTNSAPAPAMLALVDPETNAVLQTVRLESGMWDGSTLAAVPGAVWLTSFDLREPRPVATLVRVDAGTGAVTSREIDGFTHSLAFGGIVSGWRTAWRQP